MKLTSHVKHCQKKRCKNTLGLHLYYFNKKFVVYCNKCMSLRKPTMSEKKTKNSLNNPQIKEWFYKYI